MEKADDGQAVESGQEGGRSAGRERSEEWRVVAVHDAQRMTGRALRGRGEVQRCGRGGRNIERRVRDRHEQLQVDRAAGLIFVHPRRGGGWVGLATRGHVIGDVRVNLVRTVMIPVVVVHVRVHERSAKRSQRERHRQRDGRERPDHCCHSSAPRVFDAP